MDIHLPDSVVGWVIFLFAVAAGVFMAFCYARLVVVGERLGEEHEFLEYPYMAGQLVGVALVAGVLILLVGPGDWAAFWTIVTPVLSIFAILSGVGMLKVRRRWLASER